MYTCHKIVPKRKHEKEKNGKEKEMEKKRKKTTVNTKSITLLIVWLTQNPYYVWHIKIGCPSLA